MKLFTPTQAKIATGIQRDEDVAQIAYLTITLNKLQAQINNENQHFNERLKEQRDIYTAEKERLQAEVKELESVIQEKQRRLAEFLIPVDILKENAEKRIIEIENKEKELVEREEDISENQELLKEKIDNITEREIVVVEQEIKIESRLKGIEEQSKKISESQKRLNDEMTKFYAEVLDKTQYLNEKENENIIKQRRNAEYLEIRTKELDEKERSLQDRREALEREFIRLNKKQNG